MSLFLKSNYLIISFPDRNWDPEWLPEAIRSLNGWLEPPAPGMTLHLGLILMWNPPEADSES